MICHEDADVSFVEQGHFNVVSVIDIYCILMPCDLNQGAGSCYTKLVCSIFLWERVTFLILTLLEADLVHWFTAHWVMLTAESPDESGKLFFRTMNYCWFHILCMMQIHPELFSECDDPALNQIYSSIVCAAVTHKYGQWIKFCFQLHHCRSEATSLNSEKLLTIYASGIGPELVSIR